MIFNNKFELLLEVLKKDFDNFSRDLNKGYYI